MPNIRGNKISASGVSSKWVKSNEHREEKKKERVKVDDYNGQYICLKQFPPKTILYNKRSEKVNPSGVVCIFVCFDPLKISRNRIF